ncbi:MAG TPA: hypothetical protein VFW64_00045, partial [Pseudonocardiaceae bacterium]|nr:hypothetical protein [Pseudonocardiaceae bacterium]
MGESRHIDVAVSRRLDCRDRPSHAVGGPDRTRSWPVTRITVMVDGVSYVDDVEARTLLVYYLR